jgi:hypothetical protein
MTDSVTIRFWGDSDDRFELDCLENEDIGAEVVAFERPMFFYVKDVDEEVGLGVRARHGAAQTEDNFFGEITWNLELVEHCDGLDKPQWPVRRLHGKHAETRTVTHEFCGDTHTYECGPSYYTSVLEVDVPTAHLHVKGVALGDTVQEFEIKNGEVSLIE